MGKNSKLPPPFRTPQTIDTSTHHNLGLPILWMAINRVIRLTKNLIHKKNIKQASEQQSLQILKT
jgi:hypothetical protein